MKKSDYVKVVTHVPIDSLESVQKAIWEAWAGKEWDYEHCSFVVRGTGYFTPTEWAKPAIWNVWEPEQVDEYHLEFTCKKDILEKVIVALKKAHPYEEVPVQIFEYFEV